MALAIKRDRRCAQRRNKKERGGIMQTIEGTRHPWDRWFKKKQFKLVRYKHYFCMPHSMGVQIRTAAAKRELAVSVHIREDIIRVEVY